MAFFRAYSAEEPAAACFPASSEEDPALLVVVNQVFSGHFAASSRASLEEEAIHPREVEEAYSPVSFLRSWEVVEEAHLSAQRRMLTVDMRVTPMHTAHSSNRRDRMLLAGRSTPVATVFPLGEYHLAIGSDS